MPPKEPSVKKAGLTLEKLASYDDLITDALVDRVYYWTTIRKNRSRYGASRGMHEEEIAGIIRKHVILDKDPAAAVDHLLKLPGFRTFQNRLAREEEKYHFTQHLRRYVNMFMPDCPWEVTTTNRYMISEHEAAVTARKDIKKGEEIKYLTGVQVAMTKEQEESLDLSRKDFSIVISSRKKTRSLFLGPARFANHDCNANARLSTKGLKGMQIVAVRDILLGDEITVSYGEDYFGDDNEECLCFSCEGAQINGWAPYKRPDEENEDEEESTPAPEETPKSAKSEGSYSFRNKRKYDSFDSGISRDATPASPRNNKKPRLEVPDDGFAVPLSPTKRPASQPLRHATLKKMYSSSSLRQEIPLSSIEDPVENLGPSQLSREIRTQQRVGLLTVSIDEASSSRSETPQSLNTTGSPKSSESTDATSVDEDTIVVAQPPPISDTIVVKVSHEATTASSREIKPTIADEDSSSELSELSSSQELDDDIQEVVARKRSKTPPPRRATRSQSRWGDQVRMTTPLIEPMEEGMVENPRKPGDYTLTHLLLCAKFSRWVVCRTCDADFVQEDAYLTRAECPRCERHSKLYGFPWPKTDKEGKHDKEERVLDHRTVHRFIEPEEERQIKRRNALKHHLNDRASARFSTPGADSASSIMSDYDTPLPTPPSPEPLWPGRRTSAWK